MANLNAIEALYGSDDLYSPRAIQEYLHQLRRVDRAAANELHDSAEMLRSVIEHSPGTAILLGFDTKRRARLVAEPLYEAANAHNAAANLSVLAWQRFHRHFGDAIEAARKAKGKGGRRQMNWDDT